MRHQVRNKKFNRRTGQRQALFKGLVRSLLLHERILTTEPKARVARPIAERLITLGRHALEASEQGDAVEHRAKALHYRRMALAYIEDTQVIGKVFDELAKRYRSRPGGYARVVKAGFRQGDGAPLAVLELVE
ncbi:MAG: 50S ribosomal protein L17 [Chloroflexi bacterium]|nr:50S ribosomal protein L17 [Chloroflexota bacterium]